MELEVHDGESAVMLVAGSITKDRGEVFAGFHSGCGQARPLQRGAKAPLYLAPEEWVEMEFDLLGLKREAAKADWSRGGSGPARVRRFGGMADDVNAVLDGLR